MGWKQLNRGIGNANGPAVIDNGSHATLVFADTQAATIYAYDYDGRLGEASNRRVLADTMAFGGSADGSCADADGGVWSCLLNAGLLVRYREGEPPRTIDAAVQLPSDLTFGGADLDRLFFVSIAVRLEGYTPITTGDAGRLMVIDDLGVQGRTEPRVSL